MSTSTEPLAPPAVAPAQSWPDYLMNFVGRIDGAAALLSMEHDRPVVRNRRKPRMIFRSGSPWGQEILNSAFDRLAEIVSTFDTRSNGKGRSEEIDSAVFRTLAGLTPTQDQLLVLRQQDRTEAIRQLIKQLAVVRLQFKLAADLAISLQTKEEAIQSAASARAKLLESAGGYLGLTDASAELKISRQALHKKVHAGNALGMMQDDVIVLPKLQFVADGRKKKILPGIDRVAKVFKEARAGPFSALQFLIDVDANLKGRPIDALKKGDVSAVEHAAKAYLAMDEG